MDQSTALVTTTKGLARQDDTDEWEAHARDYTRRVFTNLRRIFSAERQLERAIFWVEEKRGRAILRHVKDLDRESKADDILISQTIPDQDALRISIGNRAAGGYLTPVRWELYADFELRKLLAMGRFDKRDLIGQIEDTKTDWLAGQGIVPAGDWDFDALADLHRCPLCNKLFSSDRIIFVSTEKCETCGQIPETQRGFDLMQKLINRDKITRSTITALSVNQEASSFPIQYFVNPVANTVGLWLVDCIRQIYGAEWLYDSKHREMVPPLMLIYQKSLFRATQVEYLRTALIQHLRRVSEDDWEIFLETASENGHILEGGLLDNNEESWHQDERNKKYIREMMPGFINTVIVECGEHSQGEQQ